jgi:transposase
LYGITSERKLVEELRMHLAWRWFTGLGFDQGKDRSLRPCRRCAIVPS